MPILPRLGASRPASSAAKLRRPQPCTHIEPLESRQLLSLTFDPGTDPGSTPASAYVIRNSDGTSNLLSDLRHGRYIVQQSLSSTDRVDYYRFTLAAPKPVNASLTGLSQNLNLELRNSTGTIIASSRQGGTTSEKLTSARLPAGTYYVRLAYAGASGSKSSYALTLSSGSNWAMISGYGNQVHHVGLVDLSGKQTITRNVASWVLVHGLLSTPDIFSTAGGLVSSLSSSGAVLAVDWSTASTNPLSVPWITQAGQKIGQMLKGYGITGSKLGVIGHSWGAYVGYEIGRRIGSANAIGKFVAIDPGRIAPGYSNFSSVNFRTYSTWSWGFYAGDLYGNPDKAAAADESFVMKFGSSLDDLSKHLGALTAFGQMQSTPSNRIAALFSVRRIVPRTPAWKLNQFTSGGSRSSGPYEAVLTVSTSSLLPTSLRYVTRAGVLTTLTA